MAVLQAEGRVSREVGRGTFLCDGNGAQDAPAADPADYSPADVMLVRRMFEPHAMSLVVAWATDRDFAEMDRCLHGGDASDEHDEFEVWDGALHRAIIAATHSPLLVRLYTEVERARHGKVWGDLKRRSASAARREEYKSDHAQIVTALRQRDADRASAAMRTHLARVSRHLLGTGDGLALLISCSGSGPSAAGTPPRSRCQPPSARPTASAGQAARPYHPAGLARRLRAGAAGAGGAAGACGGAGAAVAPAWSCAAHRACCLRCTRPCTELATATVAAVFNMPTVISSVLVRNARWHRGRPPRRRLIPRHRRSSARPRAATRPPGRGPTGSHRR